MAAILEGDLVADGSVPYEHGWVAYRDFGGQGPAVMLLHGLGGNLAHWGRVAPLLQERYRLIAIDLPSHGASTAPAVYSFDHDLGAVDEVRQRLGLDRPALVGHSYGGMLAVSLGASRPGDYRVVVNVDGLGFALDTEREPEPHTEELLGGGLGQRGRRRVARGRDQPGSRGSRLDRITPRPRRRDGPTGVSAGRRRALAQLAHHRPLRRDRPFPRAHCVSCPPTPPAPVEPSR